MIKVENLNSDEKMKKVIKIILLVIAAIAIVLLAALIISGREQASSPTNNFIMSAYLEKIPAGTQFTPGMQGVFSTIFKKDDQISLKGETSSFIGKVTMTVKIAKEGGAVNQDAMPPSVVKPGGFGFCCIAVPQELGRYSFHIYTQGKEEAISPLSFEVIE